MGWMINVNDSISQSQIDKTATTWSKQPIIIAILSTSKNEDDAVLSDILWFDLDLSGKIHIARIDRDSSAEEPGIPPARRLVYKQAGLQLWSSNPIFFRGLLGAWRCCTLYQKKIAWRILFESQIFLDHIVQHENTAINCVLTPGSSSHELASQVKLKGLKSWSKVKSADLARYEKTGSCLIITKVTIHVSFKRLITFYMEAIVYQSSAKHSYRLVSQFCEFNEEGQPETH